MLTDKELAEAAKKYLLDGYMRRHSLAAVPVSLAELEHECRAFEKVEPRDSMYRVSTFLVNQWWGDPAKLVDALSVLLLIWNGAFYRYGSFSEDELEACLRENQSKLDAFRNRDISSFCHADEGDAGRMFVLLSRALKRTADGVESPVSAGKALHRLAPSFFPLWDQYIAPGCGCPYSGEVASVAYIAFARKSRAIAARLKSELVGDDTPIGEWLAKKTLLKRIDEYNYMKYTIPALEKKKAQKGKRTR